MTERPRMNVEDWANAAGLLAVGFLLDFATGYLRHILGFVGITDVSFVSADRMALDPEATVKSAHDQVAALPLAA